MPDKYVRYEVNEEFDTNLTERLSDELAQALCLKIRNLLKAEPLVRTFYVETTDGPDGVTVDNEIEGEDDDELDDWEDDLEDPSMDFIYG
jgi:hypothetical protein